MYAPDATTTAVWTAMGISPSTVWTMFINLAQQSIYFGIWTIQTFWPAFLILGFLFLAWSMAYKFHAFGRR